MSVIRVFEHERLQVGEERAGVRFTERHLRLLAQYAEVHEERYYRLQHRAVKFGQYVGALQVSELTIEILPKADRSNDRQLWRNALLEMLRYCRLLQVETAGTARLQTKAHSILELYYAFFLEEVRSLIRQGLQKSYRRTTTQAHAYKGQVQWAQQLAKNHIRRDRYYTKTQQYDYSCLPNQVLWAAIGVLEQLHLSEDLSESLRWVKAHFPRVEPLRILPKHFTKIRFTAANAAYRSALKIAELLILNARPDIRAGQEQLVAVLFDMNLLFEEYVYQQLVQQSSRSVHVRRQESRLFWNRRSIRPDLVLTIEGKNHVLDTKWKVLQKANPSMQDVQQAYIYAQYFDAEKAVLLYPRVYETDDLSPTIFQPTTSEKSYFCQVHFVPILKNGRLNLELGKELLTAI